MKCIIVPCHAKSAVRVVTPDVPLNWVVPTGTTTDRTCQSPRSDSMAAVLVDVVMSDGYADTMSCFSQLESVKSADIQRVKILKYLQIGGGTMNNADLAAGFRLVAKTPLLYVFEAFFIAFCFIFCAKVHIFFENSKFFRNFLMVKSDFF